MSSGLPLTFEAAAAAGLEPYLPPARKTSTPATSSAPRSCPSSAPSSPSPALPFVTLTFATSLDSSLSLAPGVRTHLSGDESKAMTHHLRSRHAAILVGVSTVLADDPGLNCRIATGGSTSSLHPRPVIVDPHLRWRPSAGDKVLQLCRAGEGLAPYVLAGRDPATAWPAEALGLLEGLGGRVVRVPSRRPADAVATAPATRTKEKYDKDEDEYSRDDEPIRFEWRDVLETLARLGLGSVMVEGGGRVINSLLDAANHELVDSVIVTVAPTWLGKGGVVVSPERAYDGEGNAVAAARLSSVSWHPLGEDVVLCGRLQRP